MSSSTLNRPATTGPTRIVHARAMAHTPPEGTDPGVVAWVAQIAALTLPDDVVWCDGGPQEFDGLIQVMLKQGVVDVQHGGLSG